MSDVQSNICIINAENGVGTASPQITQFSSNCDCIKFIVKRDLSSCAVVVITSVDGTVSMVIEGESLSKTYDAGTKETTLLWYPQTEVTCMSGCVVYQIAAYDTADDSKFIWYSKEGRLIVTDSIDTTDYSTALIASSPNLITQLITRSKATELALNSKVDKIDGMGLSSNNYTDEEKENLKSLVTDNQTNKENIDLNSRNISNLSNEFSAYSSSVHVGENEYDPQSELAQSGKAVAEAIASIVNSAPGTLDTLQELAKALGDDPDFATTIMELLSKKIHRDEFDAAINSKFDKSGIVIDYEERFAEGDYDNYVPSFGLFSAMQEDSIWNLRVSDVVFDIENPPDVNDPDRQIAHIDAVKDYVESQLRPAPITTLPTTLEVNKQYNLGWQSEVSLAFPATANDGDVVYITFWAEDTSDEQQPNLIIDTTNTCDIEIIPEQSTGYEIFAKYNGNDKIWIVNYSEYTVSAWG